MLIQRSPGSNSACVFSHYPSLPLSSSFLVPGVVRRTCLLPPYLALQMVAAFVVSVAEGPGPEPLPGLRGTSYSKQGVYV